MFEAQFAITVGGVAVDSRFTGAIASGALMTALAEVTITGTNITYSDTVIASTSINVTAQVEYNALTEIHTAAVVDIAVQAQLEASMAVTLAAQLGG